MENSKRNTTVLIIITIAVFLVVVLGATFAYFATNRQVGNAINASAQTAASMYQFSATSNGNIEMNIAFNEMSEANISNEVLKSDNASIEVKLASPNNDTYTKCTYDIIWVWDSSDMYTTSDMALSNNYDEIELTEEQLSDPSFRCPTGYRRIIVGNYGGPERTLCRSDKTYNYEFSIMIDSENEIDLSKLSRTEKKVVLQSGVSIESNSTTTTTKTHDIKANIYNLPVEQTNLFNKKFKAHITIDNLSCNMESNKLTITAEEGSLAYYLMNDVYKSSENQTNIGNGAAGLYYHNGTLLNGAKDKILRYAGGYSFPKEGYSTYDSILIKDGWDSTNCGGNCYTLAYDSTNTKYRGPDAVAKAISDGYIHEDVNNYVCFNTEGCTNDELYRIIGVNSKTNQTKVIKATKLATIMPWNTKNGYTATEADATKGLTPGTEYKNIWAIETGPDTYYTSSLNDYLNGEYLTSLGDKANKIVETEWSVGGVNTYNHTPKAFMDVELNNKITYPAKIGLVYSSEFGFAALPEYWTIALDSSYSSSLMHGWMLELFNYSGFWTISRSGYGVNEAFAVKSAYGYVGTSYVSASGGYESGVRPTFNLSSNVKITNADSPNVGSKTNPMIII